MRVGYHWKRQILAEIHVQMYPWKPPSVAKFWPKSMSKSTLENLQIVQILAKINVQICGWKRPNLA